MFCAINRFLGFLGLLAFLARVGPEVCKESIKARKSSKDIIHFEAFVAMLMAICKKNYNDMFAQNEHSAVLLVVFLRSVLDLLCISRRIFE